MSNNSLKSNDGNRRKDLGFPMLRSYAISKDYTEVVMNRLGENLYQLFAELREK